MFFPEATIPRPFSNLRVHMVSCTLQNDRLSDSSLTLHRENAVIDHRKRKAAVIFETAAFSCLQAIIFDRTSKD